MTEPKEAQLDLLLKISEGLTKRPYEMLQVSPTDALHVPSCGLAIREAVDELRWMRAENERLRDVLRRVAVYPSGDRTARVAFVSEGCTVSFPIRPQTTWALEVLTEFDQARRKALEGNL